MVVRFSGIDPRWVVPVSRWDRVSASRSVASYTRSALPSGGLANCNRTTAARAPNNPIPATMTSAERPRVGVSPCQRARW